MQLLTHEQSEYLKEKLMKVLLNPDGYLYDIIPVINEVTEPPSCGQEVCKIYNNCFCKKENNRDETSH